MKARLRRFGADLTGASPRWGRTLILTTLVGKLSLVAAGFLIQALAGENSAQGFSGVMHDLSLASIVAAVVAAPLFESLCVMLLVWLFAGVMDRPALQTGLLVGLAAVPFHGLSWASLSVLPLFGLFGLIQFHWRARGRAWAGFWINVIAHGLVNGSSILLVAMATAEK